MKKRVTLLLFLCFLLALAGCSATPGAIAAKHDNLPFEERHLYAVAYLGYLDMEDPTFYLEHYLDEETLPTLYVSPGEYYLVIPRHPGTTIQVYRNDMDTSEMSLIYEDAGGRPFILQCNVSDIIPDATIRLICPGESVDFTPYISLKDGSVQIGERGLDISK